MSEQEKTDQKREKSDGTAYAYGMLAFLLLELAVVLDAVSGSFAATGHYYFLAYVLAGCILQVIGIVLVKQGRYRAGAILQLVVAVPHVLDLMGILGLISARKAMDLHKNGDSLAGEPAAG